MKKGKNKFKKICILCMCAFFAFSLVACSPIQLTTKQNGDGSVFTMLSIDLTTPELDTFDKKQKVYDISLKYAQQLKEQYEINLINLFSKIYNFKELGIANNRIKQVAYVLQRHNNFIAGETSFSPSIDKFNSKTESLNIEVRFYSIFAYLMYFCPKSIEYSKENNAIQINRELYATMVDTPIPSDSLREEDKFLVYNHIQTCKPFSYNLSEPKLFRPLSVINGNIYPARQTLVSVVCKELGFDSEKAQFIYNFITPYSRLHSSADIQKSNGVGNHLHSWNLGNNINALIEVWRTSANYVWWYVISIGIGVLGVTVGTIVALIIKKKKNKDVEKTMFQLEEILKYNGDNPKDLDKESLNNEENQNSQMEDEKD